MLDNEKNGVNLVLKMIEDGIVVKSDLIQYLKNNEPVSTPEKIRDDMEAWYKNMGIETLTGSPFRLKLPYFTGDEIYRLQKNGEMLLCLPGGINAATLGELFHMDCWAFHDPLVTLKTEQDDFWFSMKKNFEPEFFDNTFNQTVKRYKDDGKLNLSLERYIVFLARTKYLTGKYPDTVYKVWLPNTRYENKGVLIAGIDSCSRFCAYPWMPNFHSPKVGGRYVFIVDHH